MTFHCGSVFLVAALTWRIGLKVLHVTSSSRYGDAFGRKIPRRQGERQRARREFSWFFFRANASSDRHRTKSSSLEHFKAYRLTQESLKCGQNCGFYQPSNVGVSIKNSVADLVIDKIGKKKAHRFVTAVEFCIEGRVNIAKRSKLIDRPIQIDGKRRHGSPSRKCHVYLQVSLCVTLGSFETPDGASRLNVFFLKKMLLNFFFNLNNFFKNFFSFF